MNAQEGLQLGDLALIWRRRAPLVLGVGLGVALLGILISSLLPNQYESSAVLLIEPQTISRGLVESNLEETDLNSRLHLIQMQILSRSRLSGVIDEFDVYPEESKEMTRQEIIEMMREQVSVIPLLSELEAQAGIRNRDVQISTFQLSFRHHRRQMASDVANRLARSFVDEHIKERTRASGDTSEFIEAELNRLSDRIRRVDTQIAEVKAANTGSLPEDLLSNQRLYERLVLGVREVQRDLALAESDEAFYRQQFATGGTDFYRYQGNVLTPERRLETLRLQLGEYGSRGFTEKHPDIIHAKAEIAELENQLDESAKGEDQVLSTGQLNAKAEQQRASLRAASARAELDRVRGQLEGIEQRLARTPQVQAQLSGLEREYAHLLESSQEFSAKRLSANVAADMERRQKGERFRVLEEAVPAEELASPNRPVIIVIGIVLGLGFGLAGALLAETSDRSFHDSRSLQDRLGIPVLASVPTVVLASDRAFARRRRFRTVAAAAMVTSLVLVASLAGNWWINGVPGFVQELVGGEEGLTPAAGGE